MRISLTALALVVSAPAASAGGNERDVSEHFHAAVSRVSANEATGYYETTLTLRSRRASIDMRDRFVVRIQGEACNVVYVVPPSYESLPFGRSAHYRIRLAPLRDATRCETEGASVRVFNLTSEARTAPTS
jgi:hypothetical protein